MCTCYIQSFKILASFCSWAGWFECSLVENPQRHIFAWCGSNYARSILWDEANTGWVGSINLNHQDKSEALCFRIHFALPRCNYAAGLALTWTQLSYFYLTSFEPRHKKTYLMPYANNKDADQPAHLRSLVSTFVVRCLYSIIPILAKSKISSL